MKKIINISMVANVPNGTPDAKLRDVLQSAFTFGTANEALECAVNEALDDPSFDIQQVDVEEIIQHHDEEGRPELRQKTVAHLVTTANLAYENADKDATSGRLAAENDADDIGATPAELSEAIDQFESMNNL